MKNNYWWWWTTYVVGLILMVFGVVVFDGHVWLWETDATKLSFVIIAITTLTGLITPFRWEAASLRENDMAWFVVKTVLELGMIGTVIGMFLILSQSFGSIDASNIETIKQAIATLATGMGTALITTLTGIICSIWLSLQLTIAEN